MKTIPRSTYRREHLDNAIESARTESKYHNVREVRVKAALLIAYIDYLDATYPDWRDKVVEQVRNDYPDADVEIAKTFVRMQKFSVQIGLNGLTFKIGARNGK